MKVLVTGAGGFIGSHLVEKLVESGAKVKALVRYNSRNDIGLLNLINENFKQKIDIILCDLNDYNAVLDVAKNVE
ncbi:MAG: SDR family NAD(P)-dependent oxidoreductase, partial [Bacteroidetes bacterium]|nr:SDR family NAD(P)-dependent oxidoreductase [Bacteroidota bacterium]